MTTRKQPPPQVQLLRGRVGLVVGVSSINSIGFHIARTLADAGADTWITSTPARQSSLATLVDGTGAAAGLLLDVLGDDISPSLTPLLRQHDQLDFLVYTPMHVPGGVLDRPLTQLTRQDFHTVLDVGVHGLLRICKELLPKLKRSESPRVVALSSESSRLATPNYHVAGIAKAALESAVRYLAMELGPDGVLCNAVSASALCTDGAGRTVGSDTIEATREYLRKRSMTRVAVELEDVSQAVLWLCSPQLRNLTGATLPVDGGFSRSYF